jgi:hypothetical protein
MAPKPTSSPSAGNARMIQHDIGDGFGRNAGQDCHPLLSFMQVTDRIIDEQVEEETCW